MRSVKLGAVFGALCVLGSCIPVDDDPPVQGSKQIQQLSSHEVVALCDWATDYMGGILSNQEGDGIGHRCPGDIGVPSDDGGGGEVTYVRFRYEECPSNLASLAKGGCTLTVNDFAGWIEAIGDTPCEGHYVSNADCELSWSGNEDMQ